MRIGAVVAMVLVCSAALAVEPEQRTLTFEERVEAQKAIEKVYYAHQLGTTKPFKEAVPKAVLEAKVRKYLEQSAALNTYWKTAMTDYSLQRELERMAEGTKMPERLLELYAALGNDPFLIKECLARPALVDRLTHNFYAMDPTLHVKERGRAERIHAQLVSGTLSVAAEHPTRIVTELVVGEAVAGAAQAEHPFKERLTAEEFLTRRAELPAIVGQVSEIKETRDALVFNVVLSETTTDVRVANFAVPKISWNDWWETARQPIAAGPVDAVASGAGSLPVPNQSQSALVVPGCIDDTWENGILDDLPLNRQGHTAVWTGTEMIVWGGAEPYIRTPTWIGTPYPTAGWRYDPATDTWKSTSMVGAPTGRDEHVSVWTGHVMVVWGGRSQSDGFSIYRNTGGRYDPVTDTWTPTSSLGAPTARVRPNAIWTGHVMVVWGGNASGFAPNGLNTGGRYDPVNDLWTATSMEGTPEPRAGASAIWTGHTMIIWGGNGSTPENPGPNLPLNSGAQYDPTNDRWSSVTTTGAPTGRQYHAAVWTGREMVIWGGVGSGVLSSGGRYNPTTDSWTTISTAGAPSGRYLLQAVWTGHTMIIWGGASFFGYPLEIGGQYDPATDSWTPISGVGAPFPGEGQTAVWTGSLMVIWGTARGAARYDPATDAWTPASSANGPAASFQPATVWTGNLMTVWGGSNGSRALNTGGRYDPALDTWTPTSTDGAPSARINHTGIWTGSRMVIWGGKDWDGSRPSTGYPNTGGSYDPISDSWIATSTANGPAGREYHTAVWTGNQMVVWGGNRGSDGGLLNSGGRYDPSTDSWAPTSTVGAPKSRYWHTAVWTGSVMVVWGGLTTSFPYETDTGGRYDPLADSWSPTSLASAPEGRRHHAAIWTGSRMVVWGGYVRSGTNDADTSARYDPESDSWFPIAGGPAGRIRFTLVWTGRQMVIWGGTNDDQVMFNSGWRYDPDTEIWTPTSTQGAPGARAYHVAVWTGRFMLVWGGYATASGGRYVVADSPHDDCDGDGYTADDGDCDETRASVYPGAPQICDGIANDCSDPGWPDVTAEEQNLDGDPVPFCAGDCDNLRSWVYPGAPELCNGIDDDCDGIIDDGEGHCDDGNPCTDDSCQGLAGCAYSNNTSACDDASSCTSGDTCSNGRCDGIPVDGIACDDGNACTLNDACLGGSCAGASSLECDDGDACTGVETCNPWNGCVAGSPLTCNDYNLCTDDSCDPASGCVFFQNSRACDDGNDCTHGDVCADGWCSGAPSHGEVCNDGDPCTTNDRCYYTSCYGGPPPDCDDQKICTDDYCSSSAGGCVNEANDRNLCSDGDPCTLGDHCYSGRCAWEPAVCTGGCPPGFVPVGNLCQRTYSIDVSLLDNQDRYCGIEGLDRYTCEGETYGFHWTDLGVSLAAVTHVELRFASAFSCGDSNRSVALNGSPIGSFETVYACSCPAPIQLVAITDGDPSSYVLSGLNTIWIIRESCEGLSVSESLGGNYAEVTVTYAPYSTCLTGACDASTGACNFIGVEDGTACDDGDSCTAGDTCGNGACGGTPLACDDGNACTADSCNQATSCVHTDNSAACNDQNACTDDACNPAIGCIHADNTGPCSDNNSCTMGDACENGRCVVTALDCNDNNACTVDSCNPATGCVHTDTTPACNDNNACTVDSCNPATGCAHTDPALTCNDGNPCTTDSCNPVSGCVFTNNTSSCSDGNACTVGDGCVGGLCHGTAIVCNDNNSCTDDSCDASTGVCRYSNDDDNLCSDGNLCTPGDSCHAGSCTASAPAQCTSGCPPGSTQEGELCRKNYEIDVSLLDNLDDYCDATSSHRYNSCNGLRYGFHWMDLAAGRTVVTRVDVEFESGENCEGTSSIVRLNDNVVGNFLPPGDCECEAAHGTISFPDVAVSAYALSARNTISITPNGVCEGLSRTSNLGNSFARITVTYRPHAPGCEVGVCNPGTGACTFSTAPDGTECADGNGCTTGDVCTGGECAGSSLDCNDDNPCTDDSCVPATGCVYSNNTDACSDNNACTSGDQCGDGVCIEGAPIGCGDNNACTDEICDPALGCVFTDNSSSCDDHNPCTDDTCDPALGCVHTNNAAPCSDGNACTTGDVCSGGSCHGGPPPSCNDSNPCTDNACDPASGCVFTINTNSCDDGNACTTNDTCGGGSCNSGAPLACNDNNPCTNDTCDPASGCVFTNNINSCDDGNACTQIDTCANGSCVGAGPIVCTAADQCHDAGVCNPANGACTSVVKPNGTACNDASLCTTGETCQSGTCTAAFSGLNEPNPRTNGYYKRLCHGPHSGDVLTDADATCVALVAPTFAGISTVGDLCAMLEPSHANFNACDRTEDDLIVLALNICRARVCTAQSIDSQCGENGSVAQSLSEAQAILGDDVRTASSCAHAKCLLEEINTGRALEMNSLTLRREGGGVRLSWQPPYLDDGTAHPSKYHVWRRAQGSLSAFTKIGVTTEPTFVDSPGTGGAFQYEVTAVMN